MCHRRAVALTAAFTIALLTTGRALAQNRSAETGSISVKTAPPDAQVYIDGERWVGPDTDGRLVVQVPAARHQLEVRAPGYRSYATEIDVRPGETTPVNVSLAGSGGPGRQPVTGGQAQPAAGGITQVSNESDESGFAFSPDYRIAEVNHQTAQLLGGYGGVVFGGHLFVGGGAYGQLDSHRNNVSLTYGGAVFEWREWTDRPIGVTVHALVGGGDARLGSPFLRNPPSPMPFDRDAADVRPYYFDVHTGFFIFEPEAQVNLRLARNAHLSVGGGYRVTSTERGVSSNLLNGWSGTIGVRFGK